jgi:hypothetical protein
MGDAVDKMKRLICKELTLKHLKKLHKFVLKEDLSDAGHFRRCDVHVGDFHPMKWQKVFYFINNTKMMIWRNTGRNNLIVVTFFA